MDHLGENEQLLAYLVVAAGLKVLGTLTGVKAAPTRRQVGRVSGLSLYPIKSARGVNVEAAECTKAGLKMIRPDPPVADRYWVVTTSNYEVVTLMDDPPVARISVAVSKDVLVLSATNQETFRLPLHLPNAAQVSVSIQKDTVSGHDCGEAVADWLRKTLGLPGVRLVQYPLNAQPKVRVKYDHLLSPTDGVAFAWSCPILLIAEASLEDLNTRLETPALMETMRPNIIVEGAAAYEEEKWTRASIGPVTFEKVKLCDRCRTINVDITKGERYKTQGPLDTLRKYRPLKKEHGYRPILGMKYKVTTPGVIRIGDPVYVEE